MTVYETLSGTNSDRFHMFLTMTIIYHLIEIDGILNFSSMVLTHCKIQIIQTKVSNNLIYSSKDFYSELGFSATLNLHLKI